MFDFKGKKFLITGACGGIGSAVTEYFSSMGAKLVITGTCENRLSELQASLADRGANDINTIKCDLRDRGCVKSVIGKAVDFLDGIDVLICNAGITADNLAMRMSDDEWDSVVEVNLNSAFFLNRDACRYMAKKRYGRIINVSSVVALTDNVGQANYCASKAGLIGLSKSLAQEYAARGITINCVAPGFIKTSMTARISDNMKDAILSKIPMRSFGAPEDLVSTFAFLSSEESRYITGQVISVNGGMV